MLSGWLVREARAVNVTSWWRLASVPRLINGLLLAAASLSLLGFAIAGVLRVMYPYPLDRTEETSIQVLREIMQGHPAYGPPTLSFVPVVYPPLYFYIAAAVSVVTGGALVPLRLVSLVSSLLGAAVIAGLVGRETKNWTLGLVSAAVFAGSTHISLTSLDLGRVDALGVAWMLGALYAARTADLRPRVAARVSGLAGLLAGLAVITKQTNVVFAAALLAYAAVQPRQRLLPFGLALAATIGLPLLALYAQVGDWLRFYLIELPSLRMLEEPHLDTFWTANIFPAFTLPLAIGPIYLIGRLARGELRSAGFFALASATLLCLAWGGWVARGAAPNVLEPAYAILSVLFGLGIWEATTLLAERTRQHAVLRNYFLAMCLGQFVILGYNPRATVPLRSDGWASERLVATIATLPGTVLAPDYGEWARAAGKGDQPATGALLELTGAFASSPTATGNQWRAELGSALQARKYDYVLWNPRSDATVLKSLIDGAHYVNTGSLFKAQDKFNEWKTATTPDAEVYVPAERAPAESTKGG
ncbi:MAG: glycosyltransferase family 39 protein [Chloroflexota bacterium]|nr:glycosyltransferase family 39 protein [Chloroflexota bacterium]